MRLWGHIARGGLLAFALCFAAIAVVSPELRRQAIIAVVISTAAALLGVPALVRVFSSFTGDEDVLEHGTPGTATITSMQPTRVRFNRTYPVVRFGLSVEAAGVYPVEITQAVDPEVLARLAPGMVVGVRVDRQDRKKIVIDWREPVRTAAGAIVDQEAATGPPATASRSLWPFLRWACLLFGLIFLRLGCEEGYYEKGGVRVEGVVLQKTYSPGTSSTTGSRGSAARRTVSYRFTTKEGRTLEGRTDVLPETWADLKEGGAVVVEYLQQSPDTNRIPDQRARSRIWGIMAAVLLVASAVLFVAGWRRRRAVAVASLLIVVAGPPIEAAGAAEPFKTLDQYKPKDSSAVIKAVSLSSGDQRRFNPQAVGTEFPDGTSHVAVWYRWEGAFPGHRVEVHWFHEGTKVLEQNEQVTRQAGAEAWVLEATGGSLPTGRYRVDLLENGKTVTSIPFRVGGTEGQVVMLEQFKPKVAGAVIQSVSLSASDSDKFDAGRVGTQFSDDVRRIVVYFLWNGAPAGLKVSARWLKGPSVVGETEQTLGTPTGYGVFSVGPLPAGSYEVELLENGKPVTAVPFRIGASPR